MAGGSREKESENDQQCQHCGLWFGSEGVLNHEQHCDLADFDARKVELSCPTTLLRAGEVEVGGDPDADRDGIEDESPEDIAAGASPTAPEGASDPTDGPTPGEATDGVRADGAGPMAVPTFEAEDGDESAPESDEATTCPSCGGEDVEDPEDALPSEALEARPALRQFPHICVPCSTNDDGNWVSPVEVFGK